MAFFSPGFLDAAEQIVAYHPMKPASNRSLPRYSALRTGNSPGRAATSMAVQRPFSARPADKDIPGSLDLIFFRQKALCR
jgi:hypothetical protein